MTIQAIKCVRKHTKSVAIGVIFPPGSGLAENTNAVMTSLKKLDKNIDVTNIFFKEGQNHFENWNPTQHKLDIQLFANEYDPVVWLDSDTVVLKDLSPFIKSFVSTDKKIAVLSDHVNNDENFKKNWEGPLFIPQACYIIFRSSYISSFFKIWEDTWREWITPYPFAIHKDPAPHFNNSFFCIEQYALGQSLFKFTQNFEKDVLVIDRSQLFIGRNVAVETQKIKQQFQQKSASRPSALAHIPKQDQADVSPLIQKSANPPPRSPQAVPIETGDSSASWGGAAPVQTTTYPTEIGAEGGFLVTATYSATPGVFEEAVEPTTSSTSFSSDESDLSAVRDTLNALNLKPTSYTPSSYVTSYGVYPTSYASSYGAASTTSYGAVTSYGAAASGVTSYGAAASGVTSYGASTYGAAASGVTSYGAAASGITSYGAGAYGAAAASAGATSYGAAGFGATSYGQSQSTSYGAASSYGGASSYASSYVSSSGLSSAGLTSVQADGGIPLTNYGDLSFQFTLPPASTGEGDKEDSKTSMFVYGSVDANVYFISTSATLSSSAQVQNNLSNSNNDYYMVDLIQDNSIAHYYNANQGTNSDFIVNHGTAVADTITQIKTQKTSTKPKAPKGQKK